MAGSLVAVFGGLLAFLEDQLDLRSVRGAPRVSGDVIRYHSERTEDLEQRAEELERDSEEQKLEFRHLRQQQKTIRLLARMTASPGDAALRGELNRELELLTTLVQDQDPSGALPGSTSDTAQDSNGRRHQSISISAPQNASD